MVEIIWPTLIWPKALYPKSFLVNESFYQRSYMVHMLFADIYLTEELFADDSADILWPMIRPTFFGRRLIFWLKIFDVPIRPNLCGDHLADKNWPLICWIKWCVESKVLKKALTLWKIAKYIPNLANSKNRVKFVYFIE